VKLQEGWGPSKTMRPALREIQLASKCGNEKAVPVRRKRRLQDAKWEKKREIKGNYSHTSRQRLCQPEEKSKASPELQEAKVGGNGAQEQGNGFSSAGIIVINEYSGSDVEVPKIQALTKRCGVNPRQKGRKQTRGWWAGRGRKRRSAEEQKTQAVGRR